MINNLTDKDVLSLWQNPMYKKKNIALFYTVNRYLLNKKLDKDDTIVTNTCNTLKLNFDKFHKFLVEYINKLSALLYKNNNKLSESMILYRGEMRKHFDYKVGNILVYNTFHSMTTQIEIAAGFSQSFALKNHKRILFCIKFNKNSYCKKLINKMTYYDSITKVHVQSDEFEYLVPPNSYYCITNITKFNDIIFVKMRLLLQDHSILTTSSFYNNKILSKTCSDFKEHKINIYVNKLHNSKNINAQLMKMKKYHIKESLHDVLVNYAHRNIFNLDLSKSKNIISKLKTKYDAKNNKKISNALKKLDKLGIKVARYDDTISKDYYRYIISRLKATMHLNINKFRPITITLYAGYHNVDLAMDKYDFINEITTSNSNIYNKIITAQVTNNCFLYNCDSEFMPTITLQKDDNKIIVYYQHIIKLNLADVKIAICKTQYPYQHEIIIVPPFCWNLNKKIKMKNKFDQPIFYYDIDLYIKKVE